MFEELSGAALAVALDGVDVASLDADDALSYAVAMQRVRSWTCAGESDGLARLAERYTMDGLDQRWSTERDRVLVHEVRAAYGWSSRSALSAVDRACGLAELPLLRAALARGEVDEWRANLLLGEALLVADPADRLELERRVLAAHTAAVADGGGGLTVSRWRSLAARTALSVDPTSAQRRRTATRAERSAWHRVVFDSQGQFGMTGPVEATKSCEEAVDQLARVWRAAGRPGTLEQLRFDAARHLLTGAPDPDADENADPLADELAGAAAGDAQGDAQGDSAVDETAQGEDADAGARATGRCSCGAGSWVGSPLLRVTVPLSTLLGIDDAPGDLAGVGAIPASLARELAGQAPVWQRLLTDPVAGHVVIQDVKTYRPSAAQRRFVLARYGGCAARGCAARRGLQIDHVDPHPRGPTSATNFTPLCQGDHDPKTKGLWVHELDPQSGALTQTSPLGRRYVTRPEAPPGPTGTRARPAGHVCGPDDGSHDQLAGYDHDADYHDPDCVDAPVRWLSEEETRRREEDSPERMDPAVWAQIKADNDAYWTEFGPDGPEPTPEEALEASAMLAFDRVARSPDGFDVDHPYFTDPIAWLLSLQPVVGSAYVPPEPEEPGPPPF